MDAIMSIYLTFVFIFAITYEALIK